MSPWRTRFTPCPPPPFAFASPASFLFFFFLPEVRDLLKVCSGLRVPPGLSTEPVHWGNNSRTGTGIFACASRLGGTRPQADASTGIHVFVHNWGFAPQAAGIHACVDGGPSAANEVVLVSSSRPFLEPTPLRTRRLSEAYAPSAAVSPDLAV